MVKFRDGNEQSYEMENLLKYCSELIRSENLIKGEKNVNGKICLIIYNVSGRSKKGKCDYVYNETSSWFLGNGGYEF